RWRGELGPLVAPLHQHGVHREQRAPLVGEAVFVELARRALRVRSALEDALLDEPVEAIGEHVRDSPIPGWKSSNPTVAAPAAATPPAPGARSPAPRSGPGLDWSRGSTRHDRQAEPRARR